MPTPITASTGPSWRTSLDWWHADAPLTTASANIAAGIVDRAGGSVADAHVGAVARTTADDVVVLTSDPGDIARVTAPKRVTIVRI